MKTLASTFPAGKLLRANKKAGMEEYDYTHTLPPHFQKSGVKLVLRTQTKPKAVTVTLQHGDKDIGIAHGNWIVGKGGVDLKPHSVLIDDEWRGQKLGKMLYKAMMSHTARHFGTNRMVHDEHSSSIARVLQSMAKEYGWGYKAVPNIGREPYHTVDDWLETPSTDFDGKYKATSYMYKSQDNPFAASIIVEDGRGRILWGKRRMDGKWTLPGGHFEDREPPTHAAIREMHEETGLIPTFMQELGVGHAQMPVFVFRAHAVGEPHGHFDPDREMAEWRWVDCFDGLPFEISSNLAHPRNVALQLYGLQ